MQTFKHSSYEFTVIRTIGNGGFGEVYEVSLPTCNFKYALKKFNPTKEIADASCLSEGELVARFDQEMRYQSNCRHDNIVPICIVHSGETPFFVMDLADSDLRTLIDDGNLSYSEKIKIILDIISGLECIHNQGLIHRDLKPANILKFNDTYKISDFGLIKNTNVKTQHPNDVMSAIGLCLGTANYMAPEIHSGVYTPLGDIYALGVIIDELQIAVLNGIATKCSNRRPVDRYQSAAEIRDAILEVLK